ncbi:Fructose import ATP-binding protein FrcA [Candidatus Hydrogenisulfobacillus filiaventi]|uniref:Fructose import ATP-binding protein FrcA n=1 Tax=Candidatus Hydrogenisulfobacillus filiaventi TaxID=2707344 RepID=A0A6F8ZFM4_9FIRM|nr:ATP-binding cassette domain-containing protein [Bacillota bacterium]CAB1128262.1 Fructose import ATP-binding protein FrcA [Candidatus Hydrogenisulfobacillus filiaventi]
MPSLTAAAPRALPDAKVLELDRLSKHFGHLTAVAEASLNVGPGEVVGLVGDNGAGKSTLVRMVSGALTPSSGRIVLDGEVRHFRSPAEARAAGIETVYQDLALAPHLNVVQNLFLGRVHLAPGLPGRWWGHLDYRRMREEAAQALDSLGIRIRSLDQPVAELSGGQRQAVAIARAVMWGKHVLLLDEPTNHLGVREVDLVLDLVRRVSGHGVAVIYISHTLPHVFAIAHRIAVMRLGRMAAVKAAADTSLDEVVAYITGAKEGE